MKCIGDGHLANPNSAGCEDITRANSKKSSLLHTGYLCPTLEGLLCSEAKTAAPCYTGRTTGVRNHRADNHIKAPPLWFLTPPPVPSSKMIYVKGDSFSLRRHLTEQKEPNPLTTKTANHLDPAVRYNKRCQPEQRHVCYAS